MSVSDSPPANHLRSPETGEQATQYRVVVRSAAEAVKLLRERFGSAARVTAVRQLEAGGLSRFLQKPRLEVLVEVSAVAKELNAASAEPALPVDEESISEKASVRAAAMTAVPGSSPGSRREISLLRAVGLDEVLLERIRADHPELDWATTPPAEALTRLAAWLRREYEALSRQAVTNRRVFLGTCGSGKTAALCKSLAQDVFVQGRAPVVLKLDGRQPNATDGLAAFCEILGAPLLRAAAEVGEFEDDALLYVDVPGVGLDAASEHAQLVQSLDALQIDTRVLVVNAACEAEMLAEAFEMGRECGATHVVFSHLDEVRRPGKLWRFILQGGLTPLFLTSGPSPAGEIEDGIVSALLARTFPRSVTRDMIQGDRR